jgi:hypothetical protein
MYYVRTSGGSMMPVNFKSNVMIGDKKTVKVKIKRKQKKNSLSSAK